MKVRYLVVGSWIDKETGESVVNICAISEGKNKLGHPYGIVDTDNKKTMGGSSKVGDILTFELAQVKQKERS
jgi:hypothetical protein